MDVHDIVKQYLDNNGYDGLYMDGECACRKDDLAPCGNIDASCEPGYYMTEPRDADSGGFWIGPVKQDRSGEG